MSGKTTTSDTTSPTGTTITTSSSLDSGSCVSPPRTPFPFIVLMQLPPGAPGALAAAAADGEEKTVVPPSRGNTRTRAVLPKT